MFSKISLVLSLAFLLFACAPETQPQENQIVEPMTVPTKTPIAPTLAPEQPTKNSIDVDVAATPTLAPDAWMDMPPVPLDVSGHVREIYALGQSMGNRSDVFIKVGDSNSTTTWFLGPLGRGEYSLGDEYAYLQPAVDTFQESFLRNSVATWRGFNASAVLSPLWADKEQCESGESPLNCEMRIMQPAYALVMLGTNDISHFDEFEPKMREIIETLMDAGVIPILSTKMDNLEGDHSINATIAKLAYEYDIPLWNLWKALEPLERHGAQSDDEAHLTWAGCHFDDPVAMQSGWPWRNLTALQVINKVWQDLRP